MLTLASLCPHSSLEHLIGTSSPLLQSYLLPLIVALELGCWEWVGAGAGVAGHHPSPASAACCCLPGIDVEFASPEALVGGNLESFRRRGDG